MASGHLKSHRPMFPEYNFNKPREREALGFEGRKIFDRYGNITPVRGYSDVRSFMETNSCILLTSSMDEPNFLYDVANDQRNKVICNEKGRPILIRAGGLGRNGRGSSWIVRDTSWNDILSPILLDNINDLYDYFNVGSPPTPGSLGIGMMRYIHHINNFKRHTCGPLSMEKYFHDHGIGGIVQTPGIGREYPEALELDMCSAYLSTFTELPTGTPIRVDASVYGNRNFKAFFVECTVIIKQDLPLGPFPIREKKKGKVQWPTKKGTYHAFLWNFQIEDAIHAGCDIALSRGWGWERITTDTLQWSQRMYDLRVKAPTDWIEARCKASAVAAIGHFNMSRKGYKLVSEDDGGSNTRPYVDTVGNPYSLWITDDYSSSTATMVHWNNYCVAMCNTAVYNFALPFAKEGRLIAIDYDAILIEERNESKVYTKKQSIEALQQRPGTWMWTKLHQVKIDAHRAYTAIEHTKSPGHVKRSALDKHIQMMYT